MTSHGPIDQDPSDNTIDGQQIYREAIDNAEVDSEGAKLCWAADRLLLDIIIDELGCEKELFSKHVPSIQDAAHASKKQELYQASGYRNGQPPPGRLSVLRVRKPTI